MAKVLKVETPKHLIYKHSECGATVEYDIHEVREAYHKDIGGGGDTYYEAICPHCNRKVQWMK